MNKKNNIILPQYNCHGMILRKIRTFVCRKGRITSAQLNAIKKYWKFIGVDFQLKILNLQSLFNSFAPIVLEIGFGSGESLIQHALKYPNKNFLGIEVYQSGIGSCIRSAYTKQIKNLKIIHHDAIEVMEYMIANRSLSVIQIFFPDPWHKKRHHKRRIIQNSFLQIISKKLVIHGILHIVTDSTEYATHILDSTKNFNNFIDVSRNYFIKTDISRVTTKFEKKAYLNGNCIFNMIFKLKN